MVDHIELQSELAVDLEVSLPFSSSPWIFSSRFQHHSFRSYQGFTCLLQISSRTEDFLIDTIAVRDQLIVLNNVFTNPNVVKVI